MRFFEDVDSAPSGGEDIPETWDVVVPAPTGDRIVLLRSEHRAVVLSRFEVGLDTLAFVVRILARNVDDALFSRLKFGSEGPAEAWSPTDVDRFRLGVEYADGRRATNLVPFGKATGGPFLTARSSEGTGGAGGDAYFEADFVLTPLPPPGDLVFVCEWPALGIAETMGRVDTMSFQVAARGTITLWSEDVGGENQD